MTVMTIVMLVLGLVLLVFAADWLVRGASNIAGALGISPLVVGLTVVAFGTSAPELAVSVMSAFKGEADLAVGNVVGSNIFNVLGILGLSAIIIPLVVNQQLIRLDVPVMIFVSLLVYGLCFDGELGRLDGILLFTLLLGYIWFLLRQAKKEKDKGVLSEYEQEFGVKKEDPAWVKNVGLVIVGIGGLVLGSKWLVDGAVEIAKFFGVSELIIGLTIVSIGTSLPEVATSVLAAIKGERDIAVGNVVGSNIFNILTVLGLSAIVAPKGIMVPEEALYFDMPVMILVALSALPVFFLGYCIGRKRGVFFLLFYGAYLGHLVLEATDAAFFSRYREILMWYVVPVAAVGLLVLMCRGLMQLKNRA